MKWSRPKRSDVIVASSLYALNLFDAYATLVLMSHGADEGNPVMAALLKLGPEYFIVFKVFGVLAFTLFLLYVSFNSLTNKIIWLFTIVYACVTIYHLTNLWSFF